MERVRFGAFEFDPGSGELRREVSGAQEVRRLAPQPSRLLALLVARRGGLVRREEIREQIWPEVNVDFESSLHFCIRQIRSALDDSASDPQYVETIPRRGYRLMVPVESLEVEDEQPAGGSSGRRWLAALGAGLVVATVLLWLMAGGPSGGRNPSVRVAVMPFRPPAEWAGRAEVAPIAEWVLEELDAVAGKRIAIVGPTTTARYSDEPADLERLISDYRLEFIVNGRFLAGEEGPRLLAELIRASDGAHVWVESYRDLAAGERIGREIGRAVARELDLEPTTDSPVREGEEE